MAHPRYLREKARELRVKNRMSLNEIAECLALKKTTVWYWIKDLPDPGIKYRHRDSGQGWGPAAWKAAAEANRAKSKAKREAAYRQGWEEFSRLDAEPGFRDFVCMYIGEGYKRNRNTVSLGNSDPRIVRLANHWIKRFSRNPVTYGLQYHADQDPNYLRRFWCSYLGEPEDRLSYQRKSNSGQLKGRKWRSRYGVLTVRAGDTYLRARLQAWMDRVQDGWIDSTSIGV
jgi:hypothetical protein